MHLAPKFRNNPIEATKMVGPTSAIIIPSILMHTHRIRSFLLVINSLRYVPTMAPTIPPM